MIVDEESVFGPSYPPGFGPNVGRLTLASSATSVPPQGVVEKKSTFLEAQWLKQSLMRQGMHGIWNIIRMKTQANHL